MTPRTPTDQGCFGTTPEAHERRKAFCARLKSERERRDRSIEAIADATKVKASLLQAFERGDVSRWPKGIYRRAFFRDYVTAIGLPVSQHVAEFVELFPDGDGPPAAAAPALSKTNGSTVDGSLRITLAEGLPSRAVRKNTAATIGAGTVLVRACSAAADLAFVLILALVVSRWTNGLWPAIGMVATLYYSLCTVWLGRTLASEFLPRANWDAVQALAHAAARHSHAVFQRARSRAPEVLRDTVQALNGRQVVRESGARPSQLRPHQNLDLPSRQRREEAVERSADEFEHAWLIQTRNPNAEP